MTQSETRPKLLALWTVLLTVTFSPAARAGIPYVIECDDNDIAAVLQDILLLWPDDTYMVLTAGTCLVSDTIEVTNQEGLRIEGEGRNRTVLEWTGDEGVPMFSIQNSSGVEFSNFGICVSGDEVGRTLESAFDLYNACHDGFGCHQYDAGDPPGTHGISFADLRIDSCHGEDSILRNGIRVRLHPDFDAGDHDSCEDDEEADCNNDGHLFRNVHVVEFHDSAFTIEGKASVGHLFDGCHCDGTAKTLEEATLDQTFNPHAYGQVCVTTGREATANTAGSFLWHGGQAEGLVDSVFVLGSGFEEVHISGLDAARSRMLLRTSEQSDIGPLTLESVNFETNMVHTWDFDTDEIPPLDWLDDELSPWGVTSPVEGWGGMDTDPDKEGESSSADDAGGASSDAGGSEDSPGIVDTPDIETSEAVPRHFLLPNGYGVVVDVGNGGPLNMRGNYIGRRGGWTSGVDKEVQNISICWAGSASTNPGDDDEASLGGFVFEGNALMSSNPNPFHPVWYVGSSSVERDECVYPTLQQSNLAVMGFEDGVVGTSWVPMPQHYTTLDTSLTDEFSVGLIPTSHEVFRVQGDRSLRRLEQGIPGQVVTLVGDEPHGTPTVQHWWPGLCKIFGWCHRNLSLENGNAFSMGYRDTLTLMLGTDQLCYEVSRSDN